MDELLKYAVENGMIDLSYVQEKYKMNKREELLKKHKWAISEGKDGFWRTYLPDKEKGRRMIKKKTQKAVEDEIISYWKEQLENPTIQEVFDEWNDRKEALKKISASTHLRNIQVFNRHYAEFGKKRIKDVTAEDISEFLDNQVPKYELTSKAFSNLKSITRGFLKRAKKRKLINFDIENMLQELDTSENDFRKVIKEDYEEVFSDEETDLIIPYLIENLDPHNMGILLMFATGVRVGELVTLKHEDLHDNFLNIRRTETRYKKDNKYYYGVKDFPKTDAGIRTVVVPDGYIWLLNKIKNLNPSEEYVFINNKGNRMTTNSIRKRINTVCNKLEIYPKSPHKIRKTYGTILLDNHIDNNLIIGQMGHTNIHCTEKHYHRNRKSLEVKSIVLSAIPDFKTNSPF